jgi:peptidoglycan DL-endopeptidase CwlO
VNDGRKRSARVLATLCITALGGSMLGVAPASADPDIDSVKSQVDTLDRKAEQTSHRLDKARLSLKQARARHQRLEHRLTRERAQVAQVRDLLAAAVVAQYQGLGLSSTSQVLLSRNPDAFLDQLATVSSSDDQQSRAMADYADSVERLRLRESTAERELRTLSRSKSRLGTEKKKVDTRASEAKVLLDRLEERAAERQASRSAARAATTRSTGSTGSTGRSAATPAPAAPASGHAAAAVQYAMAQVGKSYVYGAAGPSAFDCSGLTMMAWAQAGVSLPHSSGAQMGSGTPVSQSELQPGDLVFYYSPVSHVGIYVGNGQIVNALNPGAGVRISGVNSMPYSGAVRPG